MPELQGLAVGDTVPTDPSGGFEVKVLDAGRAMVLYVDTAMVAARSATADEAAGATPAGLRPSGKFLETATPPEFAASWAFVLRPERDGGTRLIERMRFRVGDTTGATQAMGSAPGLRRVRHGCSARWLGSASAWSATPSARDRPRDAPAEASEEALAPA